MRIVIRLSIAVVVYLCLQPGFAMEEQRRLAAGAKVWYTTAGRVEQEGTDLDMDLDPGFMYGVVVSYDLGEDYWVSGMWLQGEFLAEEGDDMSRDNTSGGPVDWLEHAVDAEETDAEVIIGRTFAHMDAGVGFRYSHFTHI